MLPASYFSMLAGLPNFFASGRPTAGQGLLWYGPGLRGACPAPAPRRGCGFLPRKTEAMSSVPPVTKQRAHGSSGPSARRTGVDAAAGRRAGRHSVGVADRRAGRPRSRDAAGRSTRESLGRLVAFVATAFDQLLAAADMAARRVPGLTDTVAPSGDHVLFKSPRKRAPLAGPRFSARSRTLNPPYRPLIFGSASA